MEEQKDYIHIELLQNNETSDNLSKFYLTPREFKHLYIFTCDSNRIYDILKDGGFNTHKIGYWFDFLTFSEDPIFTCTYIPYTFRMPPVNNFIARAESMLAENSKTLYLGFKQFVFESANNSFMKQINGDLSQIQCFISKEELTFNK